METVPFLRDVDDEKHYAQLLEVAYVEAYTELRQILADVKFFAEYNVGLPAETCDMRVNVERLDAMRHLMEYTVQQSVERRRRLADVARGLADGVLDEEGA